MAQNVSMEAALPVFRQRCSELHDENLILRAQVAELEAANKRLRDQAAESEAGGPRQDHTQMVHPAEQPG